MSNSYFRNFALENNLSVDYGYLFGSYKGFFISIKETLGSTKYLYINTTITKDDLKKVLSVFTEETLPTYCISSFEKKDNYLKFTFELPNNKSDLVIEFINTFIKSFYDNGFKNESICPICNKPIKGDEAYSVVDDGGVLFEVHDECYQAKIEKKKEEENNKKEQEKTKEKSYKGLIGAIVYSLIYIAILIVSFSFVEFIINNADEDDGFVKIFQFFPVLAALSACPIISKGYDRFKGTKGTSKYLIILWTVIVSTLVGTFVGFVVSLMIIVPDESLTELASIVVRLITCKDITGSITFRWGFYVYIAVALILACISMVFKFQGREEMEAGSSKTFEKLD